MLAIYSCILSLQHSDSWDFSNTFRVVVVEELNL
jgi:hypothetical protein